MQIARQLKYLLISRSWTGSSNVVFASGSVLISSAIVADAKPMIRVPICLIRPNEAASDPEYNEEPDYIRQNFDVTIITAVPGDAIGEKPLIGANIPDRTKSEGRGILEVEEELFGAIQSLNTDTGVIIRLMGKGASRPSIDDDKNYIISRDYQFEAYCTETRYYHPPRKLAATGGVGSVSLTWQLPPDRFDRFKIILRRASGSTAPATSTAGTGVTLGSNLATSVTDSGLGAGTYSYSVYCAYDETNLTPAQQDRVSVNENGSTFSAVVVT